jgi:hypothetical protein
LNCGCGTHGEERSSAIRRLSPDIEPGTPKRAIDHDLLADLVKFRFCGIIVWIFRIGVQVVENTFGFVFTVFHAQPPGTIRDKW